MRVPFKLSTCARIAISAHEANNQVRKYTGEPYWRHCEMVVQILGKYREEIDDLNLNYSVMACAAWLHDVVEDTGMTLNTLRFLTTDEITDLVDELTYKSKLEDGNRQVRKEMDRVQMSKASAQAQYVKCADIMDNAESILTHDKDFAKVFVPECLRVLDSMRPGIKQTKIWQDCRKSLQ